MEIDYLIIGQGLAGSLLAWELIQRNKKVIIVDNAKENASLIAAGLINPVTGMRLVKSAHIDQLLPEAINYYKKLSDYFHQQFYLEKTLLRVLNNKNELAACKKRQQQTDYFSYLSQIIDFDSSIISPFGLVKQKQTGYLLTKLLLNTLKNHFISLNVYRKEQINYPEINLSPRLQWKNLLPQHIIFCEGHHATSNPWFSYLPFQPVKGEIITATASDKIPQNIINYGHWFIPLNSYKFRSGATFDREQLDTVTTNLAKKTLLDSLKRILPTLLIHPEIQQQAGIRPSTLDKHPFLGRHPNHPELVIFNGFGAKGSLQIPWYCQCLADYLLNNKPIPIDSHIMRYSDYYLTACDNP